MKNDDGLHFSRPHSRNHLLLIAVIAVGALAITSVGLAMWAIRASNNANDVAQSATKAKNQAIEALKKSDSAATREREATRVAQENERKAKKGEEQAKAQAKLANSRRIAALSESERDKHLDRSLILAVEALRLENTPEARKSLFDALLTPLGITSFLHRGEGYVRSVAFSPDGKTLAAGYDDGNRGGGVALWDVARRTETLLAIAEGSITSVAFSPNGKTLAVGYSVDSRGGVMLWDATQR